MQSREEVMADLQYQANKLRDEGRELRQQRIAAAGRGLTMETLGILHEKINANAAALTEVNRKMGAYREPA